MGIFFYTVAYLGFMHAWFIINFTTQRQASFQLVDWNSHHLYNDKFGPVSPKTLKWVVVSFECDIPHWSIVHDRSALCLYSFDRVGCHVWGMAFLCCSTMVSVPLLQSGTIAIRYPNTQTISIVIGFEWGVHIACNGKFLRWQ